MKIKVFQWNILYKEKIENIVKTIKELNPDVVCLQELGLNCKYNPSIPNTAEYVKTELGYNAFFKEAQRWDYDNELDAVGNGIFSRFPIMRTFSKHVQNQSKKFTDYAHEGRVYIEADLQLDDDVVTIGTTHLSYTHKFGVTEEKKREVDNLLNIVKDKKEKYIFTGDLNSMPDSYTIKELSNYLQNSSPPYDQNTWTTKPFNHKGFSEDKLNWRLDYIFSTKDVENISSEIIQTEYSDHLPILGFYSL